MSIQKRFIYYHNCEILCLQEVDSAKSFFSFLEEMGYSYSYRPKGPLQGILIAYKKSLFQVLDEKYVDYDSLITKPFKKEVYSTGHGAILLKVLNFIFSCYIKEFLNLLLLILIFFGFPGLNVWNIIKYVLFCLKWTTSPKMIQSALNFYWEISILLHLATV